MEAARQDMLMVGFSAAGIFTHDMVAAGRSEARTAT